jgi:hypothetical protein
MCGMNTSGTNIAEKHSNAENRNHVTSICINDTPDTLQNNCVQYRSTTGTLLERNGHEMVEITSPENNFPPPPSSSYLESINLN